MEPARKEFQPHPREKASIFSRLTFVWALKIFWTDYKEKITGDNIWGPFSRHKSSLLGDKLEKQWNRQREKSKNSTPSLMLSIFRAFWAEFLLLASLLLTMNLVDVLIRPKLLGLMLSYFNVVGGADLDTALYAAGGLLFSAFVTNFIMNHYMMSGFVLGMKMRAATVSLVYRKALRMSRATLGEVSAGQVVNLVSNDVSRFEMVAITVNYLWTAPLLACIICYFLFQEVGVAGLAGMAVIFTVAPLQSYTAKLTTKFRLQIAKKADERIRLTDEILGGIHVIKMFAWEKPFSRLLESARDNELSSVRKANFLRGSYMTFNLYTTRMALFCTLITYVLSGQRLNAGKVFVIAVYFGILAATMTSIFVRGVAEVAECFVSIKRLQKFLLNDEVIPLKNTDSGVNKNGVQKNGNYNENLKGNNLKTGILNDAFVDDLHDMTNENDKKVHVRISNVSARWELKANEPTLVEIDTCFQKSKVIGVVGSVGSGKSSLLQLVLGELKISEGDVSVKGKISYTSQESWLFGGTVMDNILLGLPYDKQRYEQVIVACSLTRDLELFPNGDKTPVGERGASLSGGQRARINLARAVYKEADIYLLDDPLSAVDAHVAKKIFQHCIKGFLKDKIVVLATHQLQFVQRCDHVIFMQSGRIFDQGSPLELVSRGHEFGGPNSGQPNQPENQGEGETKRQFSRMLSVRSVRSVSTGGDEISIIDTQEDGAEDEVPKDDDKGPTDLMAEYKGNVFWNYIKSGSGLGMFSTFVIFLLAAQACASACDIWVSRWTTQEELEAAKEDNVTITKSGELTSSRVMNISTYAVLVTSLFITAFVRGIVFYVMCYQCSKGLHTLMTNAILSTDLGFFNKNPSGAILNRFARDLGSTDELLPKSILDSCQVFGQVLGAVVTSMSVNAWFLIPVVVFAGVTVTVRHFYMKISLRLKRIENTSRSPVYTHLNSTLQGLTTIRAHESQNYLMKQFDLHQDLHTASLFTFLSAQQAYAYGLDLLGIVYLSCVTFTLMTLSQGTYGAEVGLAITQSLVITGLLQWGMRQSSEVANLMTSVERLLSFTLLSKEETNTESKECPKGQWPTLGDIKCRDLVLRYNKDDAPVLNIEYLHIYPGEKIGIVGRTGAGKSSFTNALFRLAPMEGEVWIDGVETGTIPFNYIRSKIGIIPQNPVLFSGTLRRNLDPFNQHPDYVLWRALDEVDLSEILKEGHGLDTKIAEGGSNLSVGQRQLVCLARAVVKNSKIIILDEATASVDPETDNLIQKTIRKKFDKCTVLAIAHRLNTVMDSDRILVMDSGHMVEFDPPLKLMENKRGYFYKLVQETGSSMAEQLYRQAKEAYLLKQQAKKDV